MNSKQFFKLCAGLVVCSTMACGESAFAQVVAETSTATSDHVTADTSSCTLDVWPGSQLRSTYYGWLHGGIVDGAITGRDGYKKLPQAPLDTARQRQVLAGMDVASALKLHGYTVVLHDATLESRVLRTTPGPWTGVTGPCHAELAVDDVFYQEDVFTGRYLKVIYRFRKFAGTTTPERSFGQIVAVRLVKLPPATPDDDPQPWLTELAEAFAQSVHDFGEVLQAPPRRRK